MEVTLEQLICVESRPSEIPLLGQKVSTFTSQTTGLFCEHQPLPLTAHE